MHSVEAARIIHIPGDRRREANVERTIDTLHRAGIADVAVFPGVRPTDQHTMYSIGEWGAYQSHVGAARQAAAEGRTTMILEDDAVLTGSPEQLSAFLGRADEVAWNVLHVGYIDFNIFRNWDTQLLSQPTVPVRGEMWGCQAYVVRPERLDEIVAVLDELPDRDPQLGGGVGPDGGWSEANWSLPWMIRRAAPKSMFHTIPGVASSLRQLPLTERVKHVLMRIARR
ncbi:MAG: hypothetical protein U0Q03_05475 [Acidimicrobiales bacterium]